MLNSIFFRIDIDAELEKIDQDDEMKMKTSSRKDIIDITQEIDASGMC